MYGCSLCHVLLCTVLALNCLFPGPTLATNIRKTWKNGLLQRPFWSRQRALNLPLPGKHGAKPRASKKTSTGSRPLMETSEKTLKQDPNGRSKVDDDRTAKMVSQDGHSMVTVFLPEIERDCGHREIIDLDDNDSDSLGDTATYDSDSSEEASTAAGSDSWEEVASGANNPGSLREIEIVDASVANGVSAVPEEEQGRQATEAFSVQELRRLFEQVGEGKQTTLLQLLPTELQLRVLEQAVLPGAYSRVREMLSLAAEGPAPQLRAAVEVFKCHRDQELMRAYLNEILLASAEAEPGLLVVQLGELLEALITVLKGEKNEVVFKEWCHVLLEDQRVGDQTWEASLDRPFRTILAKDTPDKGMIKNMNTLLVVATEARRSGFKEKIISGAEENGIILASLHFKEFTRPRKPRDFVDNWYEQERLFQGILYPISKKQERELQKYRPFAESGRMFEELGREAFLQKYGKGSVMQMRRDVKADVRRRKQSGKESG